MSFAYENLRLSELAAIADLNRPVFEDFQSFLSDEGYQSIYSFISSEDGERAQKTIRKYFERNLPEDVILYDGIARPYTQDKSKWLFMGWLLRDAPEQRLRPMVSSLEGKSLSERRSKLLNIIREGVVKSFDDAEYWDWHVVREVVIDRLEGSRRSIKGTLFEAIVRRILAEIFDERGLSLEIGKTEVRLEGETYDVSIVGPSGTVLMPVKTRETMGGGHALLFTRDIHKAITVAYEFGYGCIPIVIAESWTGNLDELASENSIYIDKNPNQIKIVEPILRQKLLDVIGYIEGVTLN